MNTLIQNLALIESMCIWNRRLELWGRRPMRVGEEEEDVETWRWWIR